MSTGISVILVVQNTVVDLERLLESFFASSITRLSEVIILDHTGSDHWTDAVLEYSVQGCIRHILGSKNPGFGPSCNHGAQKARYPYLLFVQPELLSSWDPVPGALARLEEDPDIGAAGVGLQNGKQDGEQNELEHTFPPAFLLCRRSDFEYLSGFRAETEFWHIDFCHRLRRELDKKCINLEDMGTWVPKRPERIKLRYFPDYSRSNPYLRLLYDHFPRHITTQPGDLGQAMEDMRGDFAHSGFIFHLHWTNYVLQGAQSDQEAEQRLEAFIGQMDRFTAQGGVIVWTVHNILPHEMEYPKLEKRLCQAVAERARIIHVHSALVPEMVRSEYDIAMHKTVVAPHGNYLGLYPVTQSKEQARQELELPLDAVVFLFLGQIRPYKGLGRLQKAFSACREKHPSARLIVAGKVSKEDKEEVAQLFARTKGVHLRLEFVPDQDLGMYLQAADYMVLPYTHVLTSGSVIMGQSYGLPSIVPDLGLLREHVQDGQSGYLYDSQDPDGLAKAMHRALEGHHDHSRLEAKALEAACNLSWKHSAAMLAARIESEMCPAPGSKSP